MSILSTIPDYVLAFFFSGFTISLCVCVADNFSPYTAGFIASFPVAMSSMIFVNRDARPETSRSFALGILTYAIFALVYYNLVSVKKWDQNTSVYICVIGWLIMASILYFIAKR